MKKLFFLTMMLIASFSMSAKNVPEGYVDLGLPSGTLWKTTNESGGFYSYQQAVNKYGENLPAMWQWEELDQQCKWIWTGNGYTVEGPNGNTIFLPVTGCRTPQGHIKGMSERGFYWGYTPEGMKEVIEFFFSGKERRVVSDSPQGGCTVRLITN